LDGASTMSDYIEYPDRYEAKVRSKLSTPCLPIPCPKCGTKVGEAVKANGTRYLADISEEGPGYWVAWKTKPHFATCQGQPPPGVIAKGTRVLVVRGRKVPLGTRGNIIWLGANHFGERCGLKDDDGNVFWTALSNVERID